MKVQSVHPTVATADGSQATLILPGNVNGAFGVWVLGSASQPVLQIVPVLWAMLGGILLLLSLVAATGRTGLPAGTSLLVVPAGVGLLGGGVLLRRPDEPPRRRGLALLLTGWCLSLLMLFHGPLWNWELNERNDVRPVARLAREAAAVAVDRSLPIYMTGNSGRRPSLGWYAQRRILRLPEREEPSSPQQFLLIEKAIEPPPSLLLQAGARCRLTGLGEQGWQLWHCTLPDPSDAPRT
jgi:hypothetical protein